MKTTVKKLLIASSIVVGVGAIASTPAEAGTLTGATIGGTAATDYKVYGSNATNTFEIKNPTATDLQKALDGNAQSPGGNVELRAASEQKTGFDFTKNTTLSGKIGGRDITLSSLTETDWFGTGTGLNTKYGANTLATKWFNAFLTNAGQANLVNTTLGGAAFNQFLGLGGFQRSSDPNIAYVNQNDATGLINIGLAGHYDVKSFFATQQGYKNFAAGLKNGFQASEVVKYTYNGISDYLYSFSATKSGLVDKADGTSHSGIYEVSFMGQKPVSSKPPQSVPEPSILLGLLGVSGIFVSQRQRKKA